MEIHKYKTLLRTTKQILKHQKEKEVLKGESFNVFSILKMETLENLTHSAFLEALLNPNGTHFKGSVFLELFLKTINSTTIDLTSVKVKTEHDIGRVDVINKTGGRIDIYIWDKKGNSIAIENKINAGDQECQVERYCNYNKLKNVVYYLTLDGKEPTDYSKGNLVSGSDFYSISYGAEIIDWLNLCLKEAFDVPILRESIKQYIILLKKLTNTMDKQEEYELRELVLKNIEEASIIATKYNKVVDDIRDDFRDKVMEFLQTETNNYTVNKLKNINSDFASLWFNNENTVKNQRWFGIESFSGKGHAKTALFVGVFDKQGISLADNSNALNKRWILHQILKFDNEDVDLSNLKFIQKIQTNEMLEIVAKDVSKQIILFVQENDKLIN